MNESQKLLLMANSRGADATFYAALPASSGGRGSSKVSSGGDLSAVLPAPSGASVPDEATLQGKIRHRALLLDVERKPKGKSARTQERSAGKVVIPKAEQKYTLYEPLAALWKAYVARAIGDGTQQNLGDRIVRMDLHGATIEVVRSRDPGLVGVKGILIAETANTILVVTKKDRVLTIPKNITVIRFVVGKKIVELMLPALAFRASERSARKLKKCKASILL